jgi:hypothetical protein
VSNPYVHPVGDPLTGIGALAATVDFAALWAELRTELTGRRAATYDVAVDLSDEGRDSAERTFGRVDELDAVMAVMDELAGRAARYKALDERHTAAMAVLGEYSVELGPLNDLSLDQIEAIADVLKTSRPEG